MKYILKKQKHKNKQINRRRKYVKSKKQQQE